ncbi:MAG: PEP/pyruvate-binding domain-containing protein [Nanoarchaeota archaeon]
MTFIKELKEVCSKDTALAGGKGASLGEMLHTSIPVPNGFVVLSTAFEAFIKSTGLKQKIARILQSVNVNKTQTVEEASKKIRTLIRSLKMPKPLQEDCIRSFKKLKANRVAVRSSATAEDSASAAWAGQLETYLNTTQKDLLGNIKKCWASLFTPRAIFYRIEKGLTKQKISVAVVIQKMVQSEVSGVAFSVHPVTQGKNQILIEAGFGLGEAIVSGQITPDSYTVDKKKGQIIEKKVNLQKKAIQELKTGGNTWKVLPTEKGRKQKLSNQQIIELSKLVQKVEDHFGFPCDIEWALEKSKFYLTQSRPITTLVEKDNVKNISLVKTYTRDTTLLIQQAWAKSCTKGFLRIMGKKNPYSPTIIHYLNDGTIELWENPQAIEWIKETILERNKKDKYFLNKIITNYKSKSKRLTGQKLPEITKLVFEIIDYFAIWYYTALEERTPSSILKKALEFREKDTFFADADQLLRAKIRENFPQLKGLENTILKEELYRLPAKGILQQRKKHFIIVDGTVTPHSTLQDYAYSNGIQIQEERANVKEGVIRGQIGYKGRVQGSVRILKRQEQIEEVKEGEILVSPMTTPQFLPAMKKAAAIITDEGGVTCHAAIVARELKKPCIIGTKIATKVLKDRDLVEVDANQGIVRILNKNSQSTYEKLFSRDFCLASVEAWVRGESTNSKEWTKLKQPFLPFIVTERSDDTVHFYYDLQGVEWVQDLLAKLAKEDKTFLKKIEKTVLKKLAYIRPIYEEEKILNLSDLKRFLKELEAGYPWFEAMWWYCQMDPKKLTGLNLKSIQKVRTLTDKLCNSSDSVIRKSLAKTYPMLGELISVLSTKEILLGKIPKKKELERRERCYFFGNDRLLVGINKPKVEREFGIQFKTEIIKEQIREIKGEIAQSGIVKGRVRRVMGHKQINEIKEGEILVSPMTLPDFLPAMKKASAIITDEGGIVCHAAIVARELKKPCITGTKIATQVLKDGDLVEVDANQGIVRILSKR